MRIVLILLMTIGMGCASRVKPIIEDAKQAQCKECEVLVNGISNGDVKWDWGTIGIMAYLQDNAKNANELRKKGFLCVEALKKALRDDDKVAIAHVLLTYIMGGFQFGAPDFDKQFNELTPHFSGSGPCKVDKAEMERIEGLWARRVNGLVTNPCKKPENE